MSKSNRKCPLGPFCPHQPATSADRGVVSATAHAPPEKWDIALATLYRQVSDLGLLAEKGKKGGARLVGLYLSLPMSAAILAVERQDDGAGKKRKPAAKPIPDLPGAVALQFQEFLQRIEKSVGKTTTYVILTEN